MSARLLADDENLGDGDGGRLGDAIVAQRIVVRGLVQGVGFRPTVWRLARKHGLRGTVANDGEGVVIHASGPRTALEAFVHELLAYPPPLARIETIERHALATDLASSGFAIIDSTSSRMRTGVVPDAATCALCVDELFDPLCRRYRYPFINCTHCGPRLSIVGSIPYDRVRTTMATFAMCSDCAAEYRDAADRRFHAEPTACHVCGPRAWLERADGKPFAVHAYTMMDDPDAACTLLQRGHIVAIKGIGGFQLACDASNAAVVAKLRSLKHRRAKAFALMARDLEVIRRYARVDAAEQAALESTAAPIVLLRASGEVLPEEVAPGVSVLGFMLPNSPLHHLLLKRMQRPIVLTSGNLSDEPQCIDNAEARQRLGGIAEFLLLHDRDIACRVDDSVVAQSAGEMRVWRRARGYAPAPLGLPPGFEAAPQVLALGGELKNSFCLLRDAQAILSHHMGNLEEARTFADYAASLQRYSALFEFSPDIVAVDRHPDYLSTKHGKALAAERGIAVEEIQHHHAHIASCMAENGVAYAASPLLGVVLDGLGFGMDDTLWGGEFLRADYCNFTRLAAFKPVAMPGGAAAIREPWRNTYAQLMAELGWARFQMNYAELELYTFLAGKPRALLDDMLSKRVHSPLASSCGRLFDAVAAACGICRESAAYEGQAAIQLEAAIDEKTLRQEDESLAYPFAIPRLKTSGLPYIEPLAMWQALLGDLILKTPVPDMAARFHKGLAIVIARMVDKLSAYEGRDSAPPIKTVALSGGVFQNRVLLELVIERLQRLGFTVLSQRQVPSNDGGLALGQAAIAAARAIRGPSQAALCRAVRK